jgi:hypothetical protein
MATGDRARDRLGEAGERLRALERRGVGGRGGPGLDPGRAGVGERVAAASAVALVLMMFFDWLGGRGGWQFKYVDLLLFLIAILAIALVTARAAGRGPILPEAEGLALTVGGGVALGIMLTLVLESTGGTVFLVLGLAAAAGILYGGIAARGEGRGTAEHTGGRRPGARGAPRAPGTSARPFDREPPAA